MDRPGIMSTVHHRLVVLSIGCAALFVCFAGKCATAWQKRLMLRKKKPADAKGRTVRGGDACTSGTSGCGTSGCGTTDGVKSERGSGPGCGGITDQHRERRRSARTLHARRRSVYPRQLRKRLAGIYVGVPACAQTALLNNMARCEVRIGGPSKRSSTLSATLRPIPTIPMGRTFGRKSLDWKARSVVATARQSPKNRASLSLLLCLLVGRPLPASSSVA